MREQSIELLNKAIADELSAMHQYLYFHFRCNDLGYDVLSNLFKRTAIEEMMHVEKLAEHILFLKGEVEMKTFEDVKNIHDVKKMLKLAAKMETASIKNYNKWIEDCADNSDAATKKIFELLVGVEKRHFDQYDKEMDNLQKYGDRYLTLQSTERSEILHQEVQPSEA